MSELTWDLTAAAPLTRECASLAVGDLGSGSGSGDFPEFGSGSGETATLEAAYEQQLLAAAHACSSPDAGADPALSLSSSESLCCSIRANPELHTGTIFTPTAAQASLVVLKRSS